LNHRCFPASVTRTLAGSAFSNVINRPVAFDAARNGDDATIS